MSSKLPDTFDISIVGGGFSALATLAHLVRYAEKPFSICVIASDGFDHFGPAYSTPRDEHLLNVRTAQMGLFEGDKTAFHTFAGQGGLDDYLPRKFFARFLAQNLLQAYEEAKEKKITIFVIKGIVDDMTQNEFLTLSHQGSKTSAKFVLLATGNSFPAVYNNSEKIIEDVWHYDFTKLPDPSKTIAIIGSGLTAVDVIISLHHAGWTGKTVCYSGNGHLPRVHPAIFEQDKIPAINGRDLKGKRLSSIMHNIRAHVRTYSDGLNDWAYVFYALRPFVPEIWLSLSLEDKQRAVKKYLWIWNIYRHRYAAHLDDIIQAHINAGRLLLKRGKVSRVEETSGIVTFQVKKPDGSIVIENAALAFRCTGPSYRPETQDVIGNLVKKGLIRAHDTGSGLGVDHELSAGKNIYAIGPLLVGEFLETTAVPEIRAAASKMAKILLSRL